jgi:hypothetical protein
MARTISDDPQLVRPGLTERLLTCGFALERVTGIEPALSAWESVPSGPVMRPDLRDGVSTSDRERPLVTGVNGPLMARCPSPGQQVIRVPAASHPRQACLTSRSEMYQTRRESQERRTLLRTLEP